MRQQHAEAAARKTEQQIFRHELPDQPTMARQRYARYLYVLAMLAMDDAYFPSWITGPLSEKRNGVLEVPAVKIYDWPDVRHGEDIIDFPEFPDKVCSVRE